MSFQSSVDFETQVPRVGAASSAKRGQVDLDSVREAVRRLFDLWSDTDGARASFLKRIEDEAYDAVFDDVRRQVNQRENARLYWEERGWVEGGARRELDLIVARFRRWLDSELEPWLRDIYPVLDARAWVGGRDDTGGNVDALLLADAIGLNAYNWNLEVDRSPFRRLDVIASADPGLVVLSELYSQSIGVPT